MTLETLRRKIDEVDDALVELLNKRAALALRIGEEKQKFGTVILDSAREDQVLSRVHAANPGPLSRDALGAIYRKIIDQCVEVQARKPRGEEGNPQ